MIFHYSRCGLFNAVCCAFLFISLAITATSAATYGNWTYRWDTPPTCTGSLDDPCGPQYWVNIEPACSANKLQSPANLNDPEFIKPSEVPLFKGNSYGCDSWKQGVDKNHFEVDFVGCRNNTVTYGGKTYYLHSIHLHSPSEHTEGGSYFDAEAHMLHYSDAGEMLLVGVLLQASAANLRTTNNTLLNTIWRNGGSTVTEISVMKSVTDTGHPLKPYLDFFPAIRSYYSYSGSLTTPPCTDSLWFVFAAPVFISLDDLNLLRNTVIYVPNSAVSEFGNTNRPIQPNNGRRIVYVESFASVDSGVDEGEEDTDWSDPSYASILLLYSVITSGCFWIAAIIYCVGRSRVLKSGKGGGDVSVPMLDSPKRDSSRYF